MTYSTELKETCKFGALAYVIRTEAEKEHFMRPSVNASCLRSGTPRNLVAFSAATIELKHGLILSLSHALTLLDLHRSVIMKGFDVCTTGYKFVRQLTKNYVHHSAVSATSQPYTASTRKAQVNIAITNTV